MLTKVRRITITCGDVEYICKWWDALLFESIWAADPHGCDAIFIFPEETITTTHPHWAEFQTQIKSEIKKKVGKNRAARLIVATTTPSLDQNNPNMLYGDGKDISTGYNVHYILRPHNLASPSDAAAREWLKNASEFADHLFCSDDLAVTMCFGIEHGAIGWLVHKITGTL